jgi:proton glutamate symport protein
VWRTVYKLKDPLSVAFGTRSTLASMPASIQTLSIMGNDTQITNLIIPLGSILARFSMVIIYVSITVFASQLYSIHIVGMQMVQIILSCIAIAVAGAGTPALVSLSLLSVVFSPLMLPYTTLVVLLLAIIPIIDPVLTVANVITNCLLAFLLGRGKK